MPRFNEAVAFCHGRRRVRSRDQRSGADASMRPWRSATEDLAVRALVFEFRGASMRPWRSATEDRGSRLAGLAAGQGFNEAVAFCHGRRPDSAAHQCGQGGASMRPWRSATEDSLTFSNNQEVAVASMRPWRSATEDDTRAGAAAGGCAASMRPWRSATEDSPRRGANETGPRGAIFEHSRLPHESIHRRAPARTGQPAF